MKRKKANSEGNINENVKKIKSETGAENIKKKKKVKQQKKKENQVDTKDGIKSKNLILLYTC